MKDSGLNIRPMAESDWPAVQAIYRQGIDTGIATFETVVPEWKEWQKNHLRHSRLVGEKNDTTIMGWAALSAVSNRSVYAGVAEVSVYVSESSRGAGIGTALLNTLIRHSEENRIWTLQAGIISENAGSIKLHQKCGFRIVGRREKLGRLHGTWKDVLLLERRSKLVGNHT